MPHQPWFSVCLHFAKLMLTVRGAKSKGAGGMAQGADKSMQDPFKEKLVATKFAIIQQIARTLLSTLRNPHSMVRSTIHAGYCHACMQHLTRLLQQSQPADRSIHAGACMRLSAGTG
jgi:hypothetical protein